MSAATNYTATGRRHYTVFSLWDTFRATHPLFTILEPDRVQEMIVIDNCSSDGTAEIARSCGARVISRPTRGFGDAVREGLRSVD